MEVLLPSPFYNWGNRLKKLTNLSNITPLERGRAGIQTKAAVDGSTIQKAI